MASPKPFKQLQAEWDKKLKKSGFEDIEQRDGNLKRWESDRFRQVWDPIKFEVKASYYRGAGQFLHSHEFESVTERRIWELHSEGMTIRDIVKKLKGSGVKSRWKVHQIIQRLAKEMVKQWTE